MQDLNLRTRKVRDSETLPPQFNKRGSQDSATEAVEASAASQYILVRAVSVVNFKEADLDVLMLTNSGSFSYVVLLW